MSTQLRARPTGAVLAPEAGLVDTVRWGVSQAVLAPSLLNSQPWLFRATADDASRVALIELFLDPRRGLPHLDPLSHEAVLACGAALLNLRLALRGAGAGAALRLVPDLANPDLLAVVTVRGPARESADERLLREAIPLRATSRVAFDPYPLSEPLVDHLVAAAAYEGALLSVLGRAEAATVLETAAVARSRSARDAGHADDLAAWTRPNTGRALDGVPGWAHGLGLLRSLAEPHRIRQGTSRVATAEAARHRADTGLLVVLGAAGEDRASLLRAGAGMQRMLLTAAANGVAGRYVDDVMHFPDTRALVRQESGLDHPHVVMHLGHARPEAVTPRRPVDEVLIIDPKAETRS